MRMQRSRLVSFVYSALPQLLRGLSSLCVSRRARIQLRHRFLPNGAKARVFPVARAFDACDFCPDARSYGVMAPRSFRYGPRFVARGARGTARAFLP